MRSLYVCRLSNIYTISFFLVSAHFYINMAVCFLCSLVCCSLGCHMYLWPQPQTNIGEVIVNYLGCQVSTVCAHSLRQPVGNYSKLSGLPDADASDKQWHGYSALSWADFLLAKHLYFPHTYIICVLLCCSYFNLCNENFRKLNILGAVI